MRKFAVRWWLTIQAPIGPDDDAHQHEPGVWIFGPCIKCMLGAERHHEPILPAMRSRQVILK